MRVLGWDIGGANIKVAVLDTAEKRAEDRDVATLRFHNRYFPMWEKSAELSLILRNIYDEIGPADVMGLTMTAELADAFLDKKEGVEFILSEFVGVFPETVTYLSDVEGKLRKVEEAAGTGSDPLDFAGANWAASAVLVSRYMENVMFTDTGSTTTDIIPILDGRIAARGKSDTERLKWGELLYLGALRTDLSSLVLEIPYRGEKVRVMREYFANTADLHLLSGYLESTDYTVPTPDGKGKDRFHAGNRLARLLSLDHSLIREDELLVMTSYIFEKELHLLEDGLLQVYSRVSPGFELPLLPSGVGSFLIEIIARRLGIAIADRNRLPLLLREGLNPAAAIALLVKEELSGR